MAPKHGVPAPFAFMMCVLLLSGCTGSTPAEIAVARSESTLPVGTMSPGVALMGQYDFRLDPATGSVDLLPVHAAQLGIGDNLTVDLTDALSGDMLKCSDCLRVTGIRRTAADEYDLLTLSFQVRHPFPAPFQEADRADLHVTNVRLALAVDGNTTFFGDVPEHPAVSTRPTLWDGLDLLEAPSMVPTSESENLLGTVLFKTTDPATPEGNYHSVYGWGSHHSGPEGFHVLAMGASASTDMRFRMPRGAVLPISGRLYLLSNFVLNTESHLTRATASYYMPEGAMLEPWHIGITQLQPIADFEDAIIEVAVIDWQAGYLVDPIYPNPDNFRGIKAPSGIAEVWLDIPGFDLPAYGPVTTATRGTGTMLDPYIYQFAIRTPLGVPGGIYPACAKVIDERVESQGVDASLNAATGLRTLTPLASYQTALLTVCDSPPKLIVGYVHALSPREPIAGWEEEIILVNDKPVVVYNDGSTGRLTYVRATVPVPSQSTDWVEFQLGTNQDSGREIDLTVFENHLWIAFVGSGIKIARATEVEPVDSSDFAIHQLVGSAFPPVAPTFGNYDGQLALYFHDNGAGVFAQPLTPTPSVAEDWRSHLCVTPALLPRDPQLAYGNNRWSVAFVETADGRARLRLQQARVDPPMYDVQWDRTYLGDPTTPIGEIALTPYRGEWLCVYHDARDRDLKYITHPSLYPTDAAGWSVPAALTSGLTHSYGDRLEMVVGLPPEGLLLLYDGAPVLDPDASQLHYASLLHDLPFEYCDIRRGVLDSEEGSGRSFAAAPGVPGTWGLLQTVSNGTNRLLETSFQAY